MTQSQACLKALVRWSNGFAYDCFSAEKCRQVFEVGHRDQDGIFYVHGSGACYESALDDADSRERRHVAVENPYFISVSSFEEIFSDVLIEDPQSRTEYKSLSKS